MTLSTPTSSRFKSVDHGIPHLDPVLIPYGADYFIFTCSRSRIIYLVGFNKNLLQQRAFANKDFGEDFETGSCQDTSPNAILVEKNKNLFVYSFGRVEYPYLLRYNLLTHETVDLNPKDDLDIAGDHSISPAAKTCVFGPDNNLIFITSKNNELMIYNIERNSIIEKSSSLAKFLPSGGKQRGDKKLQLFLHQNYDTKYLCKLKETETSVEFMLVNHMLITYVSIDFQVDAGVYKFIIKTRYKINNMMGVDPNRRKIIDFACCYVKKHDILFFTGGRANDINCSIKSIILFHPSSNYCRKSKILLPVTLASHGVVYIEKSNCLHFIGGARYEYKDMILNTKSFYISLDAFKEDIEILHKPVKNVKSTEPKKQNSEVINKKFSKELVN